MVSSDSTRSCVGTVADLEGHNDVGNRALYRLRITDAVEVVSYPMWVEIGAEQIEAGYADGR